jgi:hypothetical protein
MHVADEVVERFGGRYVFDAQRHDGEPLADGALDFLRDVTGPVCLRRKDEHHDAGFEDGINDRFAVGNAGKDIARRNPAANAIGLKRTADSIGDRLILRGIADEDIVSHKRPLPFARAIGCR